jgi:hypothetical protein
MRGPSGAFLFARDDGLTDHLSSLFESHYEGMEKFEGYRFSVRFDGNEAGLYDYATNQLLAKYIWGITPSEDYHDTTTHTIAVKLRKSLLDGHLPAKGEYRLLPW